MKRVAKTAEEIHKQGFKEEQSFWPVDYSQTIDITGKLENNCHFISNSLHCYTFYGDVLYMKSLELSSGVVSEAVIDNKKLVNLLIKQLKEKSVSGKAVIFSGMNLFFLPHKNNNTVMIIFNCNMIGGFTFRSITRNKCAFVDDLSTFTVDSLSMQTLISIKYEDIVFSHRNSKILPILSFWQRESGTENKHMFCIKFYSTHISLSCLFLKGDTTYFGWHNYFIPDKAGEFAISYSRKSGMLSLICEDEFLMDTLYDSYYTDCKLPNSALPNVHSDYVVESSYFKKSSDIYSDMVFSIKNATVFVQQNSSNYIDVKVLYLTGALHSISIYTDYLPTKVVKNTNGGFVIIGVKNHSKAECIFISDDHKSIIHRSYAKFKGAGDFLQKIQLMLQKTEKNLLMPVRENLMKGNLLMSSCHFISGTVHCYDLNDKGLYIKSLNLLDHTKREFGFEDAKFPRWLKKKIQKQGMPGKAFSYMDLCLFFYSVNKGKTNMLILSGYDELFTDYEYIKQFFHIDLGIVFIQNEYTKVDLYGKQHDPNNIAYTPAVYLNLDYRHVKFAQDLCGTFGSYPTLNLWDGRYSMRKFKNMFRINISSSIYPFFNCVLIKDEIAYIEWENCIVNGYKTDYSVLYTVDGRVKFFDDTPRFDEHGDKYPIDLPKFGEYDVADSRYKIVSCGKLIPDNVEVTKIVDKQLDGALQFVKPSLEGGVVLSFTEANFLVVVNRIHPTELNVRIIYSMDYEKISSEMIISTDYTPAAVIGNKDGTFVILGVKEKKYEAEMIFINSDHISIDDRRHVRYENINEYLLEISEMLKLGARLPQLFVDTIDTSTNLVKGIEEGPSQMQGVLNGDYEQGVDDETEEYALNKPHKIFSSTSNHLDMKPRIKRQSTDVHFSVSQKLSPSLQMAKGALLKDTLTGTLNSPEDVVMNLPTTSEQSALCVLLCTAFGYWQSKHAAKKVLQKVDLLKPGEEFLQFIQNRYGMTLEEIKESTESLDWYDESNKDSFYDKPSSSFIGRIWTQCITKVADCLSLH